MASRLAIVRFAPWMTFKNAHPHDLMWPVGLLYVAGEARRRGWTVDVIDLHVETLTTEALVERLAAFHPDMVLMDTMTPTLKLMKQVGERVRAQLPDVRLYGVGQHASEQPKDLLFTGSPFDGTVRGELDAAVGCLLDGTDIREVDGGTWWDGAQVAERGGKAETKDLDALPALEPRGLLLDGYRMRSVAVPRFGRVRWGNLLTSRGCPYPCTFCSPTLRMSHGRGFRKQSAEKVVDDMLRLNRDWGVDAFYTIDDVFSLDHKRVREVCELLIAAKPRFHWTIQTRADLLTDEMCALLYRAGCVQVKMGIESGVPRIIKQIRKNETREEMLEAAKAVHRSGLRLTAYYMLGHPSETLEEMHETIRFAHEIDADMIQVAFHTPYPGSQTWEDFKERVTNLDELNHYETQHLNASEVSNGDLERLQRDFYLKYYFTPRIFGRYLRHRLLYRATDPEEWKLAALSLKYLLLDRGVADASAA
jgi:anaerobic magnesium-protoporphyrin IX monomethyl ester cyclase